MAKHKKIPCAQCRYARPATHVHVAEDDEMSAGRANGKRPRIKLIDIECGNSDSEFYRSLLNIASNGNREDSILWGGCDHGKGKSV